MKKNSRRSLTQHESNAGRPHTGTYLTWATVFNSLIETSFLLTKRAAKPF